jgi:hypothetical protein
MHLKFSLPCCQEFGGDDKKRLQSGIDRNDLDLVYQDLFNLVSVSAAPALSSAFATKQSAISCSS